MPGVVEPHFEVAVILRNVAPGIGLGFRRAVVAKIQRVAIQIDMVRPKDLHFRQLHTHTTCKIYSFGYFVG
jgi:hypothetical protein